MTINVTPDPNNDPIRRLTNQQLWDAMMDDPEGQYRVFEVQREIERRLRRVGFLPALPLKEEA